MTDLALSAKAGIAIGTGAHKGAGGVSGVIGITSQVAGARRAPQRFSVAAGLRVFAGSRDSRDLATLNLTGPFPRQVPRPRTLAPAVAAKEAMVGDVA